MIPLLCITHYNRPDFTERCLASIDYPVAKLVVVDNSPSGNAPIVRKGQITFHTPGCGCGPAGNMIMKRFPSPWWLFSGNDVQFQPGDLEKMAKAADLSGEAAAVVGNLEAAFMAITWRGMNRVGLMDENFYPAYMEDFDWFYRCKIAGETIIKAIGVNALHGHRGECSATIMSEAPLQAANNKSYAVNVAYYKMKWGGYWQKEQFTTPYNIPNAPASYWKFMPELRKQQIWERD